MSIRDRVAEFHQKFGQPILPVPGVPDDDRVRMRPRLITEEVFEVLGAIFPRADWSRLRAEVAYKIDHEEVDVDLVNLAHELADLAYVVEGTNLEIGVDGEAVGVEVHRANMSKLGPDGRPVLRADGKVQKGPHYAPPDIARVLREQGWNR